MSTVMPFAPTLAAAAVSRGANAIPPAQALLKALGWPASRLGEDALAAAGWPIPLRLVHAGVTLAHEGAPVEWIYVVQAGTFKRLRTWEDGYEQVLGFAARGDALGFDALCSGRQLASSVALEDSAVFALQAAELSTLRRRWPALDQGLQMALSRQLVRAERANEMMAAVAAEVRLARFLLAYAQERADRGESPRWLNLRMSRRDIASLLGVAHETVSRSFTKLAQMGVLSVDNREIEIVDGEALRALTRNTRHAVETSATTARQPGTEGRAARHEWWATLTDPDHDRHAAVATC